MRLSTLLGAPQFGGPGRTQPGQGRGTALSCPGSCDMGEVLPPCGSLGSLQAHRARLLSRSGSVMLRGSGIKKVRVKAKIKIKKCFLNTHVM